MDSDGDIILQGNSQSVLPQLQHAAPDGRFNVSASPHSNCPTVSLSENFHFM